MILLDSFTRDFEKSERQKESFTEKRIMTEQYNITPEQANVLKDLEELIGRPIPLVEKIGWAQSFGVKVEGDNVIGLWLYHRGLTTLPESIGNLSSLEILGVDSNQLSALPESIGNLSSLEKLGVRGNQLSTLPESIGNRAT